MAGEESGGTTGPDHPARPAPAAHRALYTPHPRMADSPSDRPPLASPSMNLTPLPAFTDNYIWLLDDGQRTLAVDPGEADGLLAWLQARGLALDTILITHHHADHTGGVDALRSATGARVIGPAFEPMPEPLQRVAGGEALQALGVDFEVIDVPGHTSGHIAYFAPRAPGGPLLFCGDTLFSAGCGRLFEGTPGQMHESLQRLAVLPDETRVCCTHEYTLSNLRFALAVEPYNPDLQAHARHCETLRAADQPTLPSRIALERAINPFLRTTEPAVVQAARTRDPAANDPVAVLGALREWKNNFR